MIVTRILGRVARTVPGLRHLPILKLIVLGKLALLAVSQVRRLDATERRRLLELIRKGRGRSKRLTPQEREERSALMARLEPRRFAGTAFDGLSPVRLPRRLVYGRPKSGPASS